MEGIALALVISFTLLVGLIIGRLTAPKGKELRMNKQDDTGSKKGNKRASVPQKRLDIS